MLVRRWVVLSESPSVRQRIQKKEGKGSNDGERVQVHEGLVNQPAVLSNTDIDDILSRLQIKHTIIMRDQIPKISLDQYPYILNMDKTKGPGTHWVMFRRKHKSILYFDSFGRPPPQELVDLAQNKHMKLLYTDNEIQSIRSVACGYFAIVAVLFSQYDIDHFEHKLDTTFVKDQDELILNDDIAKGIIDHALSLVKDQ